MVQTHELAHQKLAREINEIPPHGHPYSVPLPGSEQPDRTPIYRHWRLKDKPLIDTLDPNVRTVHELFEQSSSTWPKNDLFGVRGWDEQNKKWTGYTWENYETIARRRAYFGMALVELHRQIGIVGRQYGIGLWCNNRPEWWITDLAAVSQSLYTVSIYDTLGPMSTEYICQHANLACVVTSIVHIPTLLALKPRLPELKILICLDELDGPEAPGYKKSDLVKKLCLDAGLIVLTLKEAEKLGESLGPIVFRPPTPDDINTINYTSGTTGPPKGVVLKHSAAVAAASTALCTVNIKPGETGLSYLPLAHIYGRMSEAAGLWSGARIGFYHGLIFELLDDLLTLKPNGLNSVPRLLNRFGGSIRAKTTELENFRGKLSRHVVDVKLANLADPESPNATHLHWFWDKIWGRKVRQAIGLQNSRAMISGSAPLDPTLQQFLRISLSHQIMQGYGLTETFATALCQAENDYSVGNCGGVAVSHELCLLSVPEMEYLVTDKPNPRGELLVRGNTMFSGYYKNDEETAKSVLPGGWFRTGDIASVDSRGRFSIIDRRKNVLKLAQGEYISPERIENVYLANLPYLANGYVHGDSSENFLVAIFGVTPELFAPWASKILGRTIAETDIEACRIACRDERIRKALQMEMEVVGRNNKFAGYERVKAANLYVEPFSVENDLMTPTMKLKRPQTAKFFRAELDALYAEANALTGAKNARL